MQLHLGRFHDITGIRVGVKTKTEKSNPEPKPEDIKEQWYEIKPIKAFERFKDVLVMCLDPILKAVQNLLIEVNNSMIKRRKYTLLINQKYDLTLS